MKMMKGRFLRACHKKWRKMSSTVLSCSTCENLCQWALWPRSQYQQNSIPRDVPKGHLVVYVGEDHKRFVIKVTMLKHPLFKPLLDQAQEEYEFTPDSLKLWIPCDESVFLGVVRSAGSPQHRKDSILGMMRTCFSMERPLSKFN